MNIREFKAACERDRKLLEKGIAPIGVDSCSCWCDVLPVPEEGAGSTGIQHWELSFASKSRHSG